MNNEDDEFKRIEAEALRQSYQSKGREFASDYERGIIDGRQMQAQSSVDKAVNAMTQRSWHGLTDDEIRGLYGKDFKYRDGDYMRYTKAIEAKLKERNT